MKDVPLNQIICGDNVEVLRTFPNDCIDLTVTSPPYDNLRTYKGYTWDFESLARELFRVTKVGGVVVWVVSDQTINGSESLTSFKQAIYFREIGFNVHDTMIWAKAGGAYKHNKRYLSVFEFMLVFSKGEPKTFNPLMVKSTGHGGNVLYTRDRNGDKQKIKVKTGANDDRIDDNIWLMYQHGQNGTKDRFTDTHPARFPEELATRHIKSWSNAGDIVLDPFCGSGTTCKMAKLLERKYIGIDIAQEYCDLSQMRVNQLFDFISPSP